MNLKLFAGLRIVSAALVLLITTGLRAQYNWSEPLPMNPKISTGKLENGLTYYILPNSKPEKKVELRLMVKSGSVSEDDDQLGLAHMAEHMAFNGTKNFKKNDIVTFLQDIGVGFGSDLNAYTFFDRTVYILPIPTDKPGNLEKGFQVLEDWAHNVTYLNEDIDGERAIILEESRLGKGAGDRMLQKWMPLYFNGSRYANRLPIGKDSIIKNFPHDAIKRYYRDWYRPDLMAVAVVGDITREKAMEMVRKHFGVIKPVANPRPLPPNEFPPYTENKTIIVTDKEATSFSIMVAWPSFKADLSNTFGSYRNSIVRGLFSSMLNARLREITQKPNPPFLSASSDFDAFVTGFDQFTLQGGSGSQNPLPALEAILTEVERVKQFGFTEPELERARKNMLSFYESAYKNRDKTESGDLVEELIAAYLDGDAAPGIENEYTFVQKIFPAVTLKDVNELASILKGDQKLFISITGPENTTGFKMPVSDDLVAAAARAAAQKLSPYEEKAIAAQLLAKAPVPGRVLSKTVQKNTGATVLKLSNNTTVILKPTDFKDDEIVMTASRYGGTSNYDIKDLYSARFAGAVQAAMGYGDFNPADLQKALSGKKVVANGNISGTRDGFSGSSTVKDLETMFQLLHLKATNLRLDTALFSSYIKKQKAQMAMAMANPQAAFFDTLTRFIYNNNPLAPATVARPADYDKVDVNRVQAILKERLGDVSGMTFVFTGSFTEAGIVPLIEKYIASLPASGKKTAFVDRKLRPVKGNKQLEFNRGKEQKSMVIQIHSGEVPYSEDLDMKTDAMTEAINIRIVEELREKLQAIYGGGVQGGLSREPYASYNLAAVLPTGPEKVDTLLRALSAEIKKLRDNGPSQEILDRVKKQWLEAHREELKNNNAWAGALLNAQVTGDNIDRFINYEKYVNKLTTKDVQATARQLLSGANMITAMQMPEKEVTAKLPDVNGRTAEVVKTFEITSADITIELYDNAEVDGDRVSVFLNGNQVVNKQNLTAKPITVTARAVRGENLVVMFAENLGSTPPNTAFMVIKSGGKEYKVELESDMKKSAAIKLVLK